MSLVGTYIRTPKKVEAARLTHDNAVDIAKWLDCSQVLLERRPMYVFVWWDGRDQIAYPGYWFVKEDGKIRLLPPDTFRDTYAPELPEEGDESLPLLFEWPEYDR